MSDILKVAIIVFLAFVFLFLVFSDKIVEKVVDKVLERIEKKYSPSPYGPGLNPDILKYHSSRSYEHDGKPVIINNADWLDKWESSRRDSH